MNRVSFISQFNTLSGSNRILNGYIYNVCEVRIVDVVVVVGGGGGIGGGGIAIVSGGGGGGGAFSALNN
ncbi:Hypothetical predicted protein [Octopus vulgaris]|uniref:Uncharacterized protein n=1 Tax=Octopus vulgaris TaxID=6645 RepID=A0AA36F3N5_OCTVU|nr:Hypothetical predicted protein [Octopus vulgaris]